MATNDNSGFAVLAGAGAVHAHARYLRVVVGQSRFAVPLDRVIGVVESSQVTPLPFSLPPFEGLVLAMGQVAPQIDLAAVLGLPTREGGVLVLVSDAGGSVGLRVAQAQAMVQVDWEDIQIASPEERAVTPMVMGRFGGLDDSVDVLDIEALTSGALSLAPAEQGAVLLAVEEPIAQSFDFEPSARQADSYVIVEVSGEDYAVKIDHLLELLELSSLRSVPHAPHWISGLLDVRGVPVLGLSLGSLLGRSHSGVGKLGLLVRQPAGRIALLAEQSHGIERYSADEVYAMREPVAGVSSYVVRPDGRIVGVLDPEALISPLVEELAVWTPVASARDIGVSSDEPISFHQFLTLRVGREYLAVPLERIQRLQASIQMTPLPADSLGFDGLADVGDGVVPVVDLRRTLAQADEPVDDSTAPPCLLAMIEGGVAGIVVHQVLRIETVPESQISPAEGSFQLPVSAVLRVNERLMSVISLDRLLPAL